MRRRWQQFQLDWEEGLRRLPFFTQRAMVALLGVLVATLALLGGLAAIVRPPPPSRQVEGPPGQSDGPRTTLVPPGSGAGQPGGGGASGPGGAGPSPAPGVAGPTAPGGAPATTVPGGAGPTTTTARGRLPGPTTTNSTTSTTTEPTLLPPISLTLPLPLKAGVSVGALLAQDASDRSAY